MEKVDGLGVVVTRQPATEDKYRIRVDMLTKQAETALGRPATLLEVILYLAAQDAEYRPATIRQYYAALTMVVDEAVGRGELNSLGEHAHREALECRPSPRPKHAEPRTSAKKRKSVEKAELHRVCTFLLARRKIEDMLLALILVHGVFLGLRPSEYSDADLQGSLLVIHSRKTTNGRGLVEFRELDLSDVSEAELASLHRLIEAFATASKGDLKRLIDRLGRRLRCACRRVGVEPFALYTTRHQLVANMKAAGKTVAEMAAVLGHGGLRTASEKYAGRSTGWKDVPTVKPTAEMVNKAEEKASPPQPPKPPKPKFR